MYIKRAAEQRFLQMSKFFKAVLVTGARQCGKTTMLRHLAEGQNRTYVSLDDISIRQLAKSDPKLFFLTYKPPITIDEVQYAPELFPYIKILCDNSEERGLFWLTGSQQFSMMKNVSESLAGRLGIMNLYPLSYNEAHNVSFSQPFELSLEALLARSSEAKPFDVKTVFEYILTGGMPAVQNAAASDRNDYFSSYISTYLMRDVMELGGVTDTVRFIKFITACAANVSEQLNLARIAGVAEVSQTTASNWLKLLQGLNIVYLLPPYANNVFKRLAKTPKMYFMDSGLCAYLAKWLSYETLFNGNQAGAYFENFAVTELIKELHYAGQPAELTYFRDSNAKEVDLFLEWGRTVHPLEIKLSAAPDARIVKKYALLDNNAVSRGYGGVICMAQSVLPIDAQNAVIPVNIL